MTIKETLEFILKSITKEDISVTSQDADSIELLEISAPKEIIGQIIGKEGKIIKAIRTILGISYPTARFRIEIKE